MQRFAGRDDPRPDANARHQSHEPTKLWVVSPCFNRPTDARNLCQALNALAVPAGLAPTLLLVDNASDPPLADQLDPDTLDPPWTLVISRQPANTGGSGGFNAGMREAIEKSRISDLVWLLDSDAVPEPEALEHLVTALGLPDVAMVGSTLIEPQTGEPFECGAFIHPATGEYLQFPPRGNGAIPCHYLAACSILTTADVIRRAGLFPETFLNGDDVGWGCRVRRATRGRLLGVPASRVMHPGPDRMRTAPRYFAARGAMVALTDAGVPVLGRAIKETLRAAALHAAGLHALGDLHMAGLQDAAAGRVMGPLPASLDPGNPDRPGLREADARALVEPPARVFNARSKRGRRSRMLNPPGSIAIEAQGGWTITTTPATQARRALGAMLRGLRLALRLQRAGGALGHAPPSPTPRPVLGSACGLSIVVVAYNRKDALLQTLERLTAKEPTASAEIIVVDNASSDGTSEAVRRRFPSISLISLKTNTGVAAFNRGVDAATGRTVLILDDDAWPDPDALALALELLDDRPEVVAVALHPRHPDGGRSEWPFARRVPRASDAWPVMGCGNLVRIDAWHRVGGYCEPYFLYRNDTDLAIALRIQGKVWFDPSWVVWHDSPAATRKSVRWCHTATRNWLWMARRHGRGPSRLLAALGVLQAFRLAGARPRACLAVVRGALAGLIQAPPPTRAASAEGWKALMRLRLGVPPPLASRYVARCQSTPIAPTHRQAQTTSATTSSGASPTTHST